MAGVAYVYKRLWNPEVVIDANNVLIDDSRQLIHGKSTPTFQVKWHGTTQAAEELGTAPSSDKDGTTTPYQVVVVSSSASDDRGNAAGMVHSVALIGNSVSSIQRYLNGFETPKTTVEVFEMNGVADVTSTRYYTNVIHAYACEWGTGATHDAEGAITVEAPPNTTLLAISATYNESEGGTIHFVDGDLVRTHSVRIAPTAAVAAGDGASVLTTWSGFGHTLNDSNIVDAVDTYTYIHYGGEYNNMTGMDMVGRKATKAAKVVLSAKLIANAQPLEIEVFIQTQNKHMYPVNVSPT